MLTPVRCITCGLPCGDVAAVYRKIRQDRARTELKKKDCHPAQSVIHTEMEIVLTDVLEALGINFDCCRRTITTAMDFRDYY